MIKFEIIVNDAVVQYLLKWFFFEEKSMPWKKKFLNWRLPSQISQIEQYSDISEIFQISGIMYEDKN